MMGGYGTFQTHRNPGHYLGQASALSRLQIRVGWPETGQMQGESGENRVRRPIEPLRRRRWPVSDQPCGAGARRPWALSLVVKVFINTLSSALRAHGLLAIRQP